MLGVERVHVFFLIFILLFSLLLILLILLLFFLSFSFIQRSSGLGGSSTHPLIGFNLFDRRRRAQAVRVHSDDI